MQFLYTYDFGDDWKHSIDVENIQDKEEGRKYPICIGGELNCPPEDCGGIPGYLNLTEILKDKSHPEYEEMREWTGRYNPQKFNMSKINRELPKFKGYMRMWKK